MSPEWYPSSPKFGRHVAASHRWPGPCRSGRSKWLVARQVRRVTMTLVARKAGALRRGASGDRDVPGSSGCGSRNGSAVAVPQLAEPQRKHGPVAIPVDFVLERLPILCYPRVQCRWNTRRFMKLAMLSLPFGKASRSNR
jgi:hypothetical protein